MLKEIQIENFAVIESEQVEFHRGLNVITGQTGAGKSILIQAIELILGAKAKPHAVREGHDFLEINALFDLAKLSSSEREGLPDIVTGDELAISRSVKKSGGGRIYINGKLSSLAVLESVTAPLVDLCGQSQYVKLTDPDYHLNLIDDYAANHTLLDEYRRRYTVWQSRLYEFERAKRECDKAGNRIIEIERALNELNEIDLKIDLRADLEGEITSLTVAEKLISSTHLADEILNSDNGIFFLLKKIGSLLKPAFDLAEKGSGSYNLLRESYFSANNELSDFSLALSQLASEVELNEERLEQCREVLTKLARLERRYRSTDKELIELKSQLETELSFLQSTLDLASLERSVLEVQTEVSKLAHELKIKREEAGKKLSEVVAEELLELNMPAVRLDLSIESRELNQSGGDKLELLFSGNKGHALKPLRQIASGGELSRIMLVLKNVLSSRSGINVLVFDEVDVGVSGSVARSVGVKLAKLAESSQVICITHLPQVASLADNHLYVEKHGGDTVSNSVVSSSVTILEGEAKIEEIARMLAGFEVTAAARESAKELLNLV
jgi:DNA repair protein RecN (Recombination protein N)